MSAAHAPKWTRHFVPFRTLVQSPSGCVCNVRATDRRTTRLTETVRLGKKSSRPHTRAPPPTPSPSVATHHQPTSSSSGRWAATQPQLVRPVRPSSRPGVRLHATQPEAARSSRRRVSVAWRTGRTAGGHATRRDETGPTSCRAGHSRGAHRPMVGRPIISKGQPGRGRRRSRSQLGPPTTYNHANAGL